MESLRLLLKVVSERKYHGLSQSNISMFLKKVAFDSGGNVLSLNTLEKIIVSIPDDCDQLTISKLSDYSGIPQKKLITILERIPITNTEAVDIIAKSNRSKLEALLLREDFNTYNKKITDVTVNTEGASLSEDAIKRILYLNHTSPNNLPPYMVAYYPIYELNLSPYIQWGRISSEIYLSYFDPIPETLQEYVKEISTITRGYSLYHFFTHSIAIPELASKIQDAVTNRKQITRENYISWFTPIDPLRVMELNEAYRTRGDINKPIRYNDLDCSYPV